MPPHPMPASRISGGCGWWWNRRCPVSAARGVARQSPRPPQSYPPDWDGMARRRCRRALAQYRSSMHPPNKHYVGAKVATHGSTRHLSRARPSRSAPPAAPLLRVRAAQPRGRSERRCTGHAAAIPWGNRQTPMSRAVTASAPLPLSPATHLRRAPMQCRRQLAEQLRSRAVPDRDKRPGTLRPHPRKSPRITPQRTRHHCRRRSRSPAPCRGAARQSVAAIHSTAPQHGPSSPRRS